MGSNHLGRCEEWSDEAVQPRDMWIASVRSQRRAPKELYPICHGRCDFFAVPPLWVDAEATPMHFWDPMLSRLTNTGNRALESAAMLRAGGMMITTIITMTTRERGAFG